MQVRNFDDFFEIDERLTADDGLMIAGGIIAEPDIPANIGAINFYRKTYSPTTDLEFTKLVSRPCTREDFIWGDKKSNNATFFETYKTKGDLELYYMDLRCLANKSDMYIAGSYDTEVAATFMIVFETCDPTKTNETGITCAPEEDIQDWMHGRYFGTVDNQKRFI